MISIGPFAQEWSSNDTAVDAFMPVTLSGGRAAEWYWLHRRWTLDISITFTPTGVNFINGSAVIEWNRRTMDGLGGPPTSKEQLPAGYQMRGLLPLGFGAIVQVEFFSSDLGGGLTKSGVKYDADLIAVRPLMQIFSADAANPEAITTSNIQDGAVVGSIDGVFLPISATNCTGHLTMDPMEDWVYP